MTQQAINVGASANDGTGDTDRAAWIKANANFAELYGFRTNVISFSASGNYTPTAGARLILVRAVGAGGGGGSGACVASGTACSGGGGGGGGAYAEGLFDPAALTAPVAVTVPSGGSGGIGVGAASNGNPGGVGGSTTFGTYLTAYGGGGGAGGGTAAAASGGGGAGYGSAGGVGSTSSGAAGAAGGVAGNTSTGTSGLRGRRVAVAPMGRMACPAGRAACSGRPGVVQAAGWRQLPSIRSAVLVAPSMVRPAALRVPAAAASAAPWRDSRSP